MSARRSTRRSTVLSSKATSDAFTPVVTLEGGSATEISANFANNENCPLFLECTEEPLSDAQNVQHAKKLKEFKDQMAKLEALAKKAASVAIHNDSAVFRTTETTTTTTTTVVPSAGPGLPTIPNKNNNYRLLMDPRTGRVLGTINGSGPMPPNLPPGATSLVRAPPPPNVRVSNPIPPRMPLPSARLGRPVAQKPSVVKPTQVVDLTRASAGPVSPSSSANKNKYPALLVHPKPQEPPAPRENRRSDLDGKVKSLLVLTPAKLTEWLIQQGLVPAEQYLGRNKLKLGMYSDSKKFPNSGGYVWISEEGRNKFVSVFRGSLFETIVQPPNVVIKLIYHWVCQTNLTNVLTWVKVDHSTVDSFYRHVRCICVASVQDEVSNFGGDDKVVEIGVISLGTTTTDGNRREVKVEVLGVLERSTGRVRLRATEPVPGASQADRFARIFKPLPLWIKRNTRIIADYSIDRDRLNAMGYANVHQCSTNQSAKRRPDSTNANVMDYLKKVVPRMFQNSLSMLPTHVIQQFLDELTFRETFGKGPLACFDSIIKHICKQTTHTSKNAVTLSSRLRSIAENPFGDFRTGDAAKLPQVTTTTTHLPPSDTPQPEVIEL